MSVRIDAPRVLLVTLLSSSSVVSPGVRRLVGLHYCPCATGRVLSGVRTETRHGRYGVTTASGDAVSLAWMSCDSFVVPPPPGQVLVNSAKKSFILGGAVAIMVTTCAIQSGLVARVALVVVVGLPTAAFLSALSSRRHRFWILLCCSQTGMVANLELVGWPRRN